MCLIVIVFLQLLCYTSDKTSRFDSLSFARRLPHIYTYTLIHSHAYSQLYNAVYPYSFPSSMPCPWKETSPIPRQRDIATQLDSKKYLESDMMYSLPALKSSPRSPTYHLQKTSLFYFNTHTSWNEIESMCTCMGKTI